MEEILAELEERIQKLQSPSFLSTFTSMFSSKTENLLESQQEFEQLQSEQAEVEKALLALEATLHEVETELSQLSQADSDFTALLDEKLRLMLDAGGETAEQIRTIAADLEASKSERQKLRKVLDLGRILIERLHSMSRSVGRARMKQVHGHGVGALANTILNQVHMQGATGSVQRASQGAGELSRAIEALPVQRGNERDAELQRLGTVIAQTEAMIGGGASLFGGSEAVVQAMEQIHNAMGLAESRLDEVESAIVESETAKRQLVLGA